VLVEIEVPVFGELAGDMGTFEVLAVVGFELEVTIAANVAKMAADGLEVVGTLGENLDDDLGDAASGAGDLIELGG